METLIWINQLVFAYCFGVLLPVPFLDERAQNRYTQTCAIVGVISGIILVLN